jgi:hypothetical protein
MAQVEARVQQNMDRAAIYLVNDVVTHFGSPSAMPEGQLTKHGVRILAARARRKEKREFGKFTRKIRTQKKRLTRAKKAMKRAMRRGKW